MLAERLARIAQSPSLAGDAFARWRRGRITVVGNGALGSHLAVQVARRGGSLLLVDPDLVDPANLGTQAFGATDVGHPKVDALASACDAIEAGRARGLHADVRNVGAGVLAQSDVIVDCTDDAALAQPLTELSNGLGIPLVRMAVDGRGEREVGRVLVSHGAMHSCQLCPLSARDLTRPMQRTPCPGGAPDRPPTLAGPAALAVVALGLHQVQRLVSGHGRERALDTELMIDLDSSALHALALTRSAACLSGHVRWDLIELGGPVTALTVRHLLERARTLHGDDARLEPHNGPLALQTSCACGAHAARVGALWSAPPRCARCGGITTWRREATLAGINRAQAQELQILDATLADLGLPDGAIVAAVSPSGVAVRLLARPAFQPFTEPFA